MDEKELAALVTRISSLVKPIQFSPAQIAQFRMAASLADQLNMQFKAAMAPVVMAAAKLQVQVDTTVTPLFQEMAMAVQRLQLPQLNEDWIRIAKRMLELHNEMAEFIIILTELGWTPAFAISLGDISFWVRLYRQHGIESIREPLGEFLTTVYDEGLMHSMLEAWKANPRLETRIPILEDVIHAHINRRYHLSIPTIISQTEGFMAQANQHNGRMSEKSYRALLEKTIVKDKQLEALIRSFVTNYLLQSFHHGELIPELSRHAILHGADVSYGTKQNSLKTILLFDYLQEHTPKNEMETA